MKIRIRLPNAELYSECNDKKNGVCISFLVITRKIFKRVKRCVQKNCTQKM